MKSFPYLIFTSILCCYIKVFLGDFLVSFLWWVHLLGVSLTFVSIVSLRERRSYRRVPTVLVANLLRGGTIYRYSAGLFFVGGLDAVEAG